MSHPTSSAQLLTSVGRSIAQFSALNRQVIQQRTAMNTIAAATQPSFLTEAMKSFAPTTSTGYPLTPYLPPLRTRTLGVPSVVPTRRSEPRDRVDSVLNPLSASEIK